MANRKGRLKEVVWARGRILPFPRKPGPGKKGALVILELAQEHAPAPKAVLKRLDVRCGISNRILMEVDGRQRIGRPQALSADVRTAIYRGSSAFQDVWIGIHGLASFSGDSRLGIGGRPSTFTPSILLSVFHSRDWTVDTTQLVFRTPAISGRVRVAVSGSASLGNDMRLRIGKSADRSLATSLVVYNVLVDEAHVFDLGGS